MRLQKHEEQWDGLSTWSSRWEPLTLFVLYKWSTAWQQSPARQVVSNSPWFDKRLFWRNVHSIVNNRNVSVLSPAHLKLEVLSLCSMLENTANQDNACRKQWWWTTATLLRCKQPLDCHHCHCHRTVNSMLFASVLPKNEKQNQHNQNPNTKKAPKKPRNKSVLYARRCWYYSCISVNSICTAQVVCSEELPFYCLTACCAGRERLTVLVDHQLLDI